jgi:hypothetical protein
LLLSIFIIIFIIVIITVIVTVIVIVIVISANSSLAVIACVDRSIETRRRRPSTSTYQSTQDAFDAVWTRYRHESVAPPATSSSQTRRRPILDKVGLRMLLPIQEIGMWAPNAGLLIDDVQAEDTVLYFGVRVEAL